ncbi:class I SAM-dependent methyltransferase [Candidatus Nomurabacteria bacterium]|nr:class I SAM-dependent methyltransferase [Candidatus Nomurabacteria bacterium]
MQNNNSNSKIEAYLSKRFKNSDSYELDHLRSDWEHKEKSSFGVLNDFKNRIGSPNGKKVLDIGFGNGIMTKVFFSEGAIMSGIEVDDFLFEIAKEYLNELSIDVDLKLYDGKKFPFDDDYFDYIYSTSVLEHVDDSELFLSEASRVLKSGGKIYLAFPNRFALRDSHSGVYFLGYFPRFMSQLILKLLKKGSLEDWNLHFLSYFSILKIIRKNKLPLEIKMETNSKYFFRKLVKKFLAIFNIHYGALLSSIVIIIEKK